MSGDKTSGGDKSEDLKSNAGSGVGDLGGRLLSEKVTTNVPDKAADKAAVKTGDNSLDAGKDQAQQVKDGAADKVVAKATDLAPADKESKMTEQVMANIDKLPMKLHALHSSHEGAHLLNQKHGHHGNLKKQWQDQFPLATQGITFEE